MYYERLLKTTKTQYYEPKTFLKDAVAYFKWADEHPLLEQKVFNDKGDIIRTDVNKTRAYTKAGLASYLGIPLSRFETYKNSNDLEWKEAIELVEQIIFVQKFEGAAAGLLNANIIARDLRLPDAHEHSGPDGKPIETKNETAINANELSDAQLKAAIEFQRAFTEPGSTGD